MGVLKAERIICLFVSILVLSGRKSDLEKRVFIVNERYDKYYSAIGKSILTRILTYFKEKLT